jgi:hypothetical protein
MRRSTFSVPDHFHIGSSNLIIKEYSYKNWTWKKVYWKSQTYYVFFEHNRNIKEKR